MEYYEAAAAIDAPADRAWRVLLDGAAYPNWDSGVTRVDGEIIDGGRITVHSDASPGRAFPVRVAIDQQSGLMTWSGGMPLGLFRGVRTFRVVPNGEECTFSMREEYTGPLLAMIWKRTPDLQPSFDRFAAGLKARTEKG